MDDRERFEWNPTEERFVEITWPEFFRKFCKDNLRFSELAMEELDEHMERDKADGPAEAEPLACPAEVREAGGSISVDELLPANEMAYCFQYSIGRIGSQYLCLMKNGAHELMTPEKFRSTYGHFACRVYYDTRNKWDVRRFIDVCTSHKHGLELGEGFAPRRIKLAPVWPTRVNPRRRRLAPPTHNGASWTFNPIRELAAAYLSPCAELQRMTFAQLDGLEEAQFFRTFTQKLLKEEPMHDYLLKWIAHMIQCPGKLPRTYLFLQSDAHGVGKNTVTDIVGCLLGPQYTWTTDRHKKALASGGETEGRDRLLLVLEEAQPGDIPAGQLNNAVTAGRIPLRKLYENTIDIQNVLRIVITTNFLASSVAVEGDRRMVLLACTDHWHRLENKENHDWSINELTRLFGIDGEFAVGHFRERAMCILYHWFLRMDITDFKPADIPQTPLTKEVKQLHNSPVWEFAKTLRHTRYRVYSEDSSKACDIREQTLDDAKRSRYEIRIKDLYDAYEYYASKYLSVEEGRKLGIKRFRDQMFSNRNSPLNKMSGVFTVKGPLNAHDTVVEIHPSGEGYIGD